MSQCRWIEHRATLWSVYVPEACRLTVVVSMGKQRLLRHYSNLADLEAVKRSGFRLVSMGLASHHDVI